LLAKDWKENLALTAKILDGAFSLLLLTHEGDVFAYRSGNKPLCFGTAKILGTTVYLIASESCAITSLGGNVFEISNPEKSSMFIKITLSIGMGYYL